MANSKSANDSDEGEHSVMGKVSYGYDIDIARPSYEHKPVGSIQPHKSPLRMDIANYAYTCAWLFQADMASASTNRVFTRPAP
jgi:hypothetical protein